MIPIRRSWGALLAAGTLVTVAIAGGSTVVAQERAEADGPAFALLDEQVRLQDAPKPKAAVGETFRIPEPVPTEESSSFRTGDYVVSVTSPDGVTAEISPTGSASEPVYEFTPQTPGDYRISYSAVGENGTVDFEDFDVVAGNDAEVEKARAEAARRTANDNQPQVTFGSIGDIHNEWRDLDKAFDLYHAQDLDATLFVGDLTNNATAGEYAGLKEVLDRRLDENGDGKDDISLVAALGNHDVGSGMTGYDLFTQSTGGQRPNADYVINGYHFITVSPGSGRLDEETGRPTQRSTGDYAYARDWLHTRMAAATAEHPDRPVFVLVHHPLKCTHYVSNEWYGAGLSEGCGDTFKSVFDNFPQAVVWGGHIHTPNNISTSIWQDGGFTTVNAPPLAYFEMESGVDNDTTPNDAGDNAQTAVVEVAGSVVKVKNYDLQAGRWIDQTWTWDVEEAIKNPQRNFPYTDRRAARTAGPKWPAGSAVTVSDIKEDSAQVSFPQAKPAANDVQDIVHLYRYQVVDKSTGATVADFKQWSGFYILPLPATRGHAIRNLKGDTRYEVRVTPYNTWGKAGGSISTTFKTAPPPPPVDPADYLVYQDFESVAGQLQYGVEHNMPANASVLGWTKTTPAGWTITNSPDMPTGTKEMNGWSLMTKAFWQNGDDQDRSGFTLGRNIVAVADPDEWDDVNDPESRGRFDSTLTTPSAPIPAGTSRVYLAWDNHYREEEPQEAEVTVEFDTGQKVQLVHWTPANTPDLSQGNKTVNLPVDVPAGATSMKVSFRLFNAMNDWYWAIDHVRLDTEPIV